MIENIRLQASLWNRTIKSLAALAITWFWLRACQLCQSRQAYRSELLNSQPSLRNSGNYLTTKRSSHRLRQILVSPKGLCGMSPASST